MKGERTEDTRRGKREREGSKGPVPGGHSLVWVQTLLPPVYRGVPPSPYPLHPPPKYGPPYPLVCSGSCLAVWALLNSLSTSLPNVQLDHHTRAGEIQGRAGEDTHTVYHTQWDTHRRKHTVYHTDRHTESRRHILCHTGTQGHTHCTSSTQRHTHTSHTSQKDNFETPTSDTLPPSHAYATTIEIGREHV